MKNTYKLALSSIFTALSITLLYFGSILNTLEFTAIAIAATILVIVYEECDKKYAWLTYFSVMFLSFFLVTYVSTAILYALYGFYPILKYDIDKKKSKTIRLILKSFAFGISTLLAYILLVVVLKIIITELEFQQFAQLIHIGLTVSLIIIFIMFDKFLTMFRIAYLRRIKPKISKRR